MGQTKPTQGDRACDVAVVVVTYNSESLLEDFFAAIPAAMDGIESYVVVVSDNASADSSIGLAQRLSPDSVIVRSDANKGYATAINAGVVAAGKAANILVLNDDIRLRPGSVRSLLDGIAADHQVGIAVPRLVDGDGRLLLSQRREPTISRAFGEAILGGDRAGRFDKLGGVVQDRDAYYRQTDPTWTSGCAWLISGTCWESVGQWDESLFLYSEDVDYALRTRDAGFVMRFVPEAEAVHLVGPSHRDPRLWSMAVWNRYRLYNRRHGFVRSQLFRLGLLLNESIRALAGRGVHGAGALALISTSHRPPEVHGNLPPISR
ncbi:MAG: glycosyltransferase family 2 protein [Actinomycetia bacterium]|nr:glycosyltransferase family 2 protein [Actinomycetes bacterium]